MKSKFSTSIKGGKTKLQKAFTEKGLYMVATILKSPQATQTTIAIIETFAKLRSLSRNIQKLSNVKNKETQKELMQNSDNIIADILGKDLGVTDTETTVEINKIRASCKTIG